MEIQKEWINEQKSEALEAVLLDAVKSFVESIYMFTESAFNVVPFTGSWTAREVSSHVSKSMRSIHQAIVGNVIPADRDPEQFISVLEQMMKDLSVKREAAARLLPDESPKTRADLRNELTEVEQLLLKDVRGLDLSVICTGMEFPGLGYLTRFELISVAAFHTRRHIRQLQNIYKAL